MRGATWLRTTALCAQVGRTSTSPLLSLRPITSSCHSSPSPSPYSSPSPSKCPSAGHLHTRSLFFRSLHSSGRRDDAYFSPPSSSSSPSSSSNDDPNSARNPRTSSTTTSPTTSTPRLRPVPRGYTTQRDIDRSGRARPPWDHEITDPLIMVIDNSVAEGPLSTKYVLTKLEPGESLRMIQPYHPGFEPSSDPSSSDPSSSSSSSDSPPSSPPSGPSYAICKIVNKRDEYERQRQVRERKRAAAQQKPKTKELEITWAIGGNDLLVKMGRLRSFLDKGMKVELTIGRKKGGRRVGEDEAVEVLRRVREEMEASGAREGKAATGHIGGTMKLFLEGVARK